MVNILVVEDNLRDLDYCVKLINKISSNVRIYKASSGNSAYEIISRGHLDGALIDIEMPGMDGFELAFRMRRINKMRFFPIVFITITHNDTLEVYREYHHCGYIQKPYTSEEFNAVIGPFLEGVIAQKEKMNVDKFSFQICDNIEVRLSIDEILYIETINRVPNIVTYDANYRVKRKNLNEIIEEINNENFIQCHRKCYVNINKIYKICHITYKSSDLYFTKDGSIKCPLSYTYKIAVIDKFMENKKHGE
ncbi:LytTR family DNA-binding domain-containing protein [Anaerovorax odorimutans]|uniref:Stage 0 sporulation protein A homolog n=1 Tax=Anaerovorax odorimutans TaxID=109327 RepID=A0ABT1RTE4_9FIRM|nr:LytTR family DNA-binding domain-containing protein [Anaerovorax odorimutans]MCQ4638478.1 LytTR family DNA-binding domain-containing protein [Anaerovorax odorimutans]